MQLSDDFLRTVYYHNLTPIHIAVHYDYSLNLNTFNRDMGSLEENLSDPGEGDGYSDEYGEGDGKGAGDSYGYLTGNGYGYGDGSGRGAYHGIGDG